MPCELCGLMRHSLRDCHSHRKVEIITRLEAKLVLPGNRATLEVSLMGESKLNLRLLALHFGVHSSGNKTSIVFHLITFEFERSRERRQREQRTQSQLNRDAFQRRVQEQQQGLFHNYEMTPPVEYLRTNPFAGLPLVAPLIETPPQQQQQYLTPQRPPPTGRQIQLSCSDCVMTDDECAICFGKTYIQTQCGHSFCHCIVQHIGKKPKVDCPLCRTEITQLKFNQAVYYNVLKSTAGMLPMGRFAFA